MASDDSALELNELDRWEYDGYRVGRTTRTVEVQGMDGPNTIEEGTIRFEPINSEDVWMWEADEWMAHLIAPDGQNEDFANAVHLPHDQLGTIEFPEPMTDEEADEWLDENPEEWQRFVDDTIESDVTASDLLDEVR